MRKMYRTKLAAYCEENRFDKNDPPPQAVEKIATEVIEFLRKHAEGRNHPLPETVRLMHVVIEPAPAPDGFKETTSLVFEHNASATPTATPLP